MPEHEGIDTLQGGFERMMNIILPKGCPPKEMQERQATFFAGAATAFNLIQKAGTAITEDESTKKLQALLDEIIAFHSTALLRRKVRENSKS